MRITRCLLLAVLLFLAGCGEPSPETPPARESAVEYSVEEPSAEELEAPTSSLEEDSVLLRREGDYSACLSGDVSLRFTVVEADKNGEYSWYDCAWVDDNVLLGLHAGEKETVLVRYDDTTQSTEVFHLDLVLPTIRDMRVVAGDLLIHGDSGHYLVGADGEVKNTFVYGENGIVLDHHYSHMTAVSDDFSRFAYLEVEGDIAGLGWHRTVLLDIPQGTRTVLHQEAFPPEGEFFPFAPVAFSPSGDYLFCDTVVFRGHDWRFAEGRFDLRTGSWEAITGDSVDGYTASVSGDNRVLLKTSYTGILSLTRYDFASGQATALPVGSAANSDGPLPSNGDPWYYVTDSWGEYRMYDVNAGQYTTLFHQAGEESLPNFQVKAASPNGRKAAGFCCDRDGSYLITVFEWDP